MSARCGALSTLVVMAALLVGVPAASGAVTTATPWVQMSTPHPGLQPYDELVSVSCLTPKFCMAVGNQEPKQLTQPLAEVWTGSWKVTPTPNPTPTGESGLRDVACTSPSFCMALAYGNFAELWNGSTWTVTTLPFPVNTNSSFYGASSVSCFGTDCLAVGGHNFYTAGTGWSYQTAAAEWDGQGWSLDPTSVAGALYDVSCYASEQCLAVGALRNGSGGGTPLAETFDAGAWSNVTPAVPGLQGLIAVRCVSISVTCTALTGAGLAVVWTGSSGTWTASSPPPSGGLSDISCATTTWCVAVGYYSVFNNGGAGTETPVADAWTGSQWTVMNTSKFAPNDVYPENPFHGVSCPSSTFCVAVGSRQVANSRQPFAASWGTVP